MIEIIDKNGRIKLVPKGVIKNLKGDLAGWRINDKSVKRPYDEPVKKETKKQEPVELTREQMVDYLKEKGVKVHWNLSDEKLKKRYEDEKSIN